MCGLCLEGCIKPVHSKWFGPGLCRPPKAPAQVGTHPTPERNALIRAETDPTFSSLELLDSPPPTCSAFQPVKSVFCHPALWLGKLRQRWVGSTHCVLSSTAFVFSRVGIHSLVCDEGGGCQGSRMVSDTMSRHLVSSGEGTCGSEVYPGPRVLESASPPDWGTRFLIHLSSFYQNHIPNTHPGQGELIATPRVPAAQRPQTPSCDHTGLQFLSPPSMTHSMCRGPGMPGVLHPQLVSPSRAFVWIVARGVAQRAPVPSPVLCPSSVPLPSSTASWP